MKPLKQEYIILDKEMTYAICQINLNVIIRIKKPRLETF